jgi:hypothetical protein
MEEFLERLITASLTFVSVLLFALAFTTVIASIVFAIFLKNAWWLTMLLATPVLWTLLEMLTDYILWERG